MRNIFIAVLCIFTFFLYYQNVQINDYSESLEIENKHLKEKINALLHEKENLTLKYFSPLYKEVRFYSALPYSYQWYLQKDYQHISNYYQDDKNELVDFYNNLDILPEVIYDEKKDDLTIKLQIKKVF